MAVTVVIGALLAVSYARSRARDPGLTTEIALLTTVLLGALAIREPVLASGIAVVVVILLASRTRLHRFVKRVLTEQELHDLLLLAAAALVVLPLAPDRAVGPLSVINPRTVWRLVVIFMAISGAGYIGLRLLGPGIGLALSGFASGFVSSSATIGAMGARARENPAVRPGAVAGAVLWTVATIIQMALLLAATSRATLWALAGRSSFPESRPPRTRPSSSSGASGTGLAEGAGGPRVPSSRRGRLRGDRRGGHARVGGDPPVARRARAGPGRRGRRVRRRACGRNRRRLCRRVRPDPARRRSDSDPGRSLDQHDHQSHARGAVAGPGLRSRGPPRAAPRDRRRVGGVGDLLATG